MKDGEIKGQLNRITQELESMNEKVNNYEANPS